MAHSEQGSLEYAARHELVGSGFGPKLADRCQRATITKPFTRLTGRSLVRPPVAGS